MSDYHNTSTLEALHGAEHNDAEPFAGYDEWLDSLDDAGQTPPPFIPSTASSAMPWDDDPEPTRPTARELRGRELAIAGEVLAYGPSFIIAGSTRNRYYVRPHGHTWACECGDWEFRIAPALEAGTTPADRCCKHGYAAEYAIAHGLVVDSREGRCA
jgi:hypothetical protein